MTWLYVSPTIQFDTNFESANLASSERVNEFEYDLFIQPDNLTQTRLWFYFRVSNVPLNLPILFNIIGISKAKTTFATQQRIVVRSSSRTKWQRLPADQQFYAYSQKHKVYTNNPVLSFIFQFDRQEEYFFSFGYPYTYTMLQKFVNKIECHNLPFVRLEVLGQSFQQRNILLITIANLSKPHYKSGQVPLRPHTVLLVARCHSGEFPGSYVVHGIMEYLMSNNPRAQFLRSNVEFQIVPMINVDGVVNGYYRTNASGYDLNRSYADPPEQCPESRLLKNLYANLLGEKISEPENAPFESNQFNYTMLQIARENGLYCDPVDGEAHSSAQVSSKASSRPRQPSAEQFSLRAQAQPQLALPVASNLPRPLSQPPPLPTVSAPASLAAQPPHNNLNFVFDLHSHSNIPGGFLFLNPDSGVFYPRKRLACEQVFPQLLKRNCAVFDSLNCSFKESKNVREGSLRRAFAGAAKDALCDLAPYIYGIEVSNSHGLDPREGGKGRLRSIEESSDDGEELPEDADFVIYTPELYGIIGAKICDTLWEIYAELFMG